MIVAADRLDLIRPGVVGSATAIAEWGDELARNPGSARAGDERVIAPARHPVAELSPNGTIAGYKPKSALGRRLLQLRQQYAEQGGKFLTEKELDEEVARRRIGYEPDGDA
jgi:hypothetical protein